jgi:hypothetical protein
MIAAGFSRWARVCAAGVKVQAFLTCVVWLAIVAALDLPGVMAVAVFVTALYLD